VRGLHGVVFAGWARCEQDEAVVVAQCRWLHCRALQQLQLVAGCRAALQAVQLRWQWVLGLTRTQEVLLLIASAGEAMVARAGSSCVRLVIDPPQMGWHSELSY
jgi:hypothetical protein